MKSNGYRVGDKVRIVKEVLTQPDEPFPFEIGDLTEVVSVPPKGNPSYGKLVRVEVTRMAKINPIEFRDDGEWVIKTEAIELADALKKAA